jgi:hypothetical protein
VSKKEPLENIYWLAHDSTASSLTAKSITACRIPCNHDISFDPTTPMPAGCYFEDWYRTNYAMLLYYTS